MEHGKQRGSTRRSHGGHGRAGRVLQFRRSTASSSRSQQEERRLNRSSGEFGTHHLAEESRDENCAFATHPVRGAASGRVTHHRGRRHGGGADRGRGPRGSCGGGSRSSEPRGNRHTLQQAQPTSSVAVQPRLPSNRQSNPRLRPRKLKQLKDLASKDAGEILTVISNGTKWFSEVLGDPAIRDDSEMMRLVVRCLAIAFDMLGLDSTVGQAMTVAVEAKFFNSLASFNRSKLNDLKDSDEAGQVIADQAIVFDCILERCPGICASSIRPAVEAGIFAVRELSRGGIVIDKASANAMTLLGNRINKLRDVPHGACKPRDEDFVRRDKRRRRQQDARDMRDAPDEDFRSLPVVPSAGELLQAGRPFIRSNITRGQYRDVDHYLDVQFRLMREDFVRPLREGIRSVMRFVTEDGKLKAGYNRVENINIYEEASVTDLACDQRGVQMALRFSLKNLKQVKWQVTKRLMQGSLLCLTHDGFKTIMFATVADSDPKEMSKGVVMIRPESHQENLDTWTGKKFLVIESEAFFEAYRHFFSCLQKMMLAEYPLKKYIVDLEKKIALPAYYTAGLKGAANAVIPLSHMSAKPGAELHADPIRGSWPTPQRLNLDESQLRAFAAGLTREFAIIQGPPGTGKTFIGLKKVKTILERRRLSKLNNEGPILVVCVTNHALDQFLEGMEAFTKNILRVGSRSSSEKLKPYLLPSVRERLREEAKSRGVSESQLYLSMNLRKKMRARLESIEFDRTVRDALSSGNGVLKAEVIRAVDPKIWIPANFSVARWLGLDATASDGGSSAWERTDESIHQTSQQEQDSLQGLLAAMKIDDDDEERDESEVGGVQNPADAAEVEIEAVETLQQKLLELETYYDEDVAQIRVSGAEANKVYRAVFETSDRQLRKQMYQAGDHLDALDKQNAEMEARLNSDDEALSEEEFETWRVMYQRKRCQAEKDGQTANAALKTLTGARRYLRVPRSFDLKRPTELPADGNIMNLSYLTRWLLYRYWANQHARAREAAMKKEIVKCDALAPRLDEARSIELLHLVKKMDVVGMTTTGAAKNFTVVQNMKAKVVIVEEAAEVLECHIVCCLSRHCEHLILIGDHQQLRPSPTVYNLATDHNFDISLFERMLNNGVPYESLRTQHRMRPEIAQLLKPHIYKDLEDHRSVADRENIRGVKKNVFFVTHNHQEDSNADSKSKSNRKEAYFLLAMCQYLLLQGYKASEITILTGYSGQSIVVKNLLSLYPACKEVSITLVDSFQGEENRIILLSLVRSNEGGKIGFLKTENRVNVALSRAKEGLFIVGNMDSLCADPSSIWRKIRVVLEEQQALGRGLPLRCEIHPDETMIASAPEQFPATGGCSKVCNLPLKCGHLCQNTCHVSDLEHLTNANACRRPCERICAAGKHRWRGVCGQDLYPACKAVVTRILPACKHHQAMLCADDPSKVSCFELCNAKIRCGHVCARTCHVQDDPGHKLYRCEEPCEKECFQRHKCRGKCGDSPCPPCVEKVLKKLPCGHEGRVMCHHMHASAGVSCMEKCRQILACGHPCQRRCNQKCGRCYVPVQKYVIGCSHRVTMPCGTEALRIHCHHCKEKCDPGMGPAELDRERGSPHHVARVEMRPASRESPQACCPVAPQKPQKNLRPSCSLM